MGSSLTKLAQRKRSNERGPNKNRQNRTQRNGSNSNGMPVAGPSNENQHSISHSIFKLNRHCFDELFEYLALRDLHSLGQTCKLMQQMTGQFFTLNYSAAKFNCLRDGIYMFDIDKDGALCYNVGIDRCIPVSDFIPLITWIAIENNILKKRIKKWKNHRLDARIIYHLDLGKFKYFKLHSGEFKSVKKLTLTNVRVDKQTVGYILKILPNIEVLELKVCTVATQGFYDVLLKYCKNVRRIQLFDVKFKSNYKWLLQQYEKLEHLKLGVHTKDRINELCTFFEVNPNVRSFSCDESILLSNKDALLNSKVKLDIFELTGFNRIDSLWDFLCQLHDHGFYKRLHLKGMSNSNTGRVFPETQFLEQIVLHQTFVPPNLRLNHLIEYSETGDFYPNSWNTYSDIADLEVTKNEMLAENLTHVERLYLYRAEFDILLFIRKLRNLKKLKLCRFQSAEILQLDKLNKEREKLGGARKVTIYVPDAVYLATKWATTNGTTNFSLIEMKRIDSYEWNRSCIVETLQLPPGML